MQALLFNLLHNGMSISGYGFNTSGIHTPEFKAWCLFMLITLPDNWKYSALLDYAYKMGTKSPKGINSRGKYERNSRKSF